MKIFLSIAICLLSFNLIAQNSNYIYIEKIDAKKFKVVCDGQVKDVQSNNFCLIPDLNEGTHQIQIIDVKTGDKKQFETNIVKNSAYGFNMITDANGITLKPITNNSLIKEVAVTNIVEENTTLITTENNTNTQEPFKSADYKQLVEKANSNNDKKYKGLFAESKDKYRGDKFSGAPVAVYYAPRTFNSTKPEKVKTKTIENLEPEQPKIINPKTVSILTKNEPDLETLKKEKAKQEANGKALEEMRLRQMRLDEEKELSSLEKQKQELLKAQETKREQDVAVYALLKKKKDDEIANKLAQEKEILAKKERENRAKAETIAKAKKEADLALEQKKKEAQMEVLKRKEQEYIALKRKQEEADAAIKKIKDAENLAKAKKEFDAQAILKRKQQAAEEANKNKMALLNAKKENDLKLQAEIAVRKEKLAAKLKNDSTLLEVKKAKVAEAKRVKDSLSAVVKTKKIEQNSTSREKETRLNEYAKKEDLKKLQDLQAKLKAEEERLYALKLEQTKLKEENDLLKNSISSTTKEVVSGASVVSEVKETTVVDNTTSMVEHRNNAKNTTINNTIKTDEPKTAWEKKIDRVNAKVNSNCVSIITEDDLVSLFKKLEAKVDDDARLSVVKKYLGKNKNCYFCKDVQQLSLSFNTQNGKYDFVKQLFPYVTDPKEAKEIENIFTFESLREKVRLEFGLN